MLEKGEWSDLKIHTPTRTFNVHKSVVCLACPFLQAACAGDWKEARAGIIPIPENECIVRACKCYAISRRVWNSLGSSEKVADLRASLSVLAYCYGVFETDLFDEDSSPSPDEEVPVPIDGIIEDMILRYAQLTIAADKVYKELTTFYVTHANIMTVWTARAQQTRQARGHDTCRGPFGS